MNAPKTDASRLRLQVHPETRIAGLYRLTRGLCDLSRLAPDSSMLSVFGRFTRRGGIEINPYRSNRPISSARGA